MEKIDFITLNYQHKTIKILHSNQMSHLISLITNKPDWQTKINNKAIVSKWKAELLTQSISSFVVDKVIELLQKNIQTGAKEYEDDDEYNWVLPIGHSAEQLGLGCLDCDCQICKEYEHYDPDDYEDEDEDEKPIFSDECLCKDNLKEKKKEFLKKHILMNDDVIDEDLRDKFIAEVEAVKKSKPTDYHPNSNNMVVDIVHPSLNCFVKGLTKLNDGVAVPPITSIFQWIPTEFRIKTGKSGGKNVPQTSFIKTDIMSPINNLDRQKFPSLYNSIEDIFSCFVPRFRHVLDKFDVKVGSNLQVIVKIAETVLTPDKPLFNSGSWHLEGVPAEQIIATGIYYYKTENISDSYLQFRTTMSEHSDYNYPQSCNGWFELHYGLGGNDKAYNGTDTDIYLGKVRTKQDGLLVFPNNLQHCVSDFELVDKTKPGVRSILVFFLINPSVNTISTKDIKDNTMSLQDAKLYRELLMFERKYEMKDQSNFFERSFSLCEH